MTPTLNVCFDVLLPNVYFDEGLTRRGFEEAISEISLTRGNVDEGKLIIAKGEVVEARRLPYWTP